MTSIEQLNQLGQSVWYDNIQRGLIDSGALAELIAKGVSGITSNPTIFEKAIGGSHDYDQAIRDGVMRSLSLNAIYDQLTLEDIARGADLLRPVYDRTDGADGFISIEVPPTLARDTEKTLIEARRLFNTLGRPNVMIKVPATEQGIPAIQQLISEGINVNVTLIFSLKAYAQVMDAFLNGLEMRAHRGEPVDHVNSVASFFVSRLDTLVDRLIQERHQNPDLSGKAAIANAKMAYQLFRTRFSGPQFAKLAAKGARVQRPLWASTSTKNPSYPELLYVRGLIGPDTVNTMPPATVDAVLKASDYARTVDQDLAAAKAHLDALASHGIEMDEVTDQLLREGVESFEASFVSLFRGLAEKRLSVLRELHPDQYALGAYQAAIETEAAKLTDAKAVDRLFSHDATLWSAEAEHQAIITNALGWLTVPEWAAPKAQDLEAFARQVRQEGYTDAVVLGMGGSSLVSDVLIEAFPQGEQGLTLHVLDTTNPLFIEELGKSLPLEHTLFIVASKSGTTTEPNAFYHYFWKLVTDHSIVHPENHFIAITDPATSLEKEATEKHFRRVFINPADIGGRYSALSLFGLVPAALKGLAVSDMLDRALAVSKLCHQPKIEQNPGAFLGVVLGTLARSGRDKVTFLLPQGISHMADWIEQLLAESTGKQGRGLIPIAHEDEIQASAYGQDRVFVTYRTPSHPTRTKLIDELVELGHPVVDFYLDQTMDLAGEFFRWEVATALAGAVLGIDAFDQPNVQESKDNTKRLLQYHADHGGLPETPVDWGQGPWEVRSNRISVAGVKAPTDLWVALQAVCQPGDYLALLAYVNPTRTAHTDLQRLRGQLQQVLPVATTLGFGPRFLHSTGQLHKGGPDSGVFVQIIEVGGPDVEVPNQGYDFETLILAQALGDYESLVGKNRRVLSIRIHGSFSAQLRKLMEHA